MRRILAYFLVVLAAGLFFSSCGKEGRVIPRSELSKIYAEMFVADTWLLGEGGYDARVHADSTGFYEPIFKAHGYTTADYYASVSHYLNDPDRFARILHKTNIILTAQKNDADKRMREEKDRQAAENLQKKKAKDMNVELYCTFFEQDLFTDRILMHMDSTGRYMPVPVVEDTMFHGPALIVKSDSLAVARDTVKRFQVSELTEAPELSRRDRPEL